MKIKTKELAGPALDWAVAKCEGLKLYRNALLGGQIKEGWWVSGYYMNPNNWIPLNLLNFSTNWAQGGPIIERERINVVAFQSSTDWGAEPHTQWKHDARLSRRGPTPLIAAMRCYVTNKLGDTVDVPDNLE